MDFEAMSDAEIRAKMIEFDVPFVPITATTRKVILKTLKQKVEGNKSVPTNLSGESGRTMGQYSSEDDSDRGSKSSTRRRRATVGVPVVEESAAQVRKSSKRMSMLPPDKFNDVPKSEPSSFRSSVRVPTSYSTPNTDFTYSPGATSSPHRSSYILNTNDALSDALYQKRTSLNFESTDYDDLSTYSPIKNKATETPFLSNFTRQLSQASRNNPKPYGYVNDVIKEYDAGDSNKLHLLGRLKHRGAMRDYYPQHTTNIIKNNLVSFAVFGVALLFFIVVGVMYWGMRSNGSALETSGYSIPLCSSITWPKHGFNCVNENDLENIVPFLKALEQDLKVRAENHVCKKSPFKPYMTETDIISYYHRHSNKDMQLVQQHLQLVEVLIFKNTDCSVSIVQVDDNGDSMRQHVLKDMSEVIELRPVGSIALVVLDPDVPWKCTLYNKLASIIFPLFVIVSVFGVLYAINYSYKYYNSYRQSQKNEVINMVEQILEILQNNSAEENENYLVINHVRDMILPINDRKRMEAAWDQAVKFINENESRVRTEVQTVKGEPFEVWRWISSNNLNATLSPRSKTWQGQAFETQVGSVNSLPCSPTPCLKIRGMLDGPEQNASAIREAVLSKLAHQCRILHCAVDIISKCVYLKCADQAEAAIAYRNLHGWWYASQLVTVKYLRLERYTQRFPDSPQNGPPFLKSSSPAPDATN